MQTSGPLRQRASVWGQALAGPARFAALAAFAAVAIGLGLLARYGTPPARIGAALAGVLLLVLAALSWIISRRRAGRPREIVRRVILPTNAPLGTRALRAAALLERQEREEKATSEAERKLAEFHFERLIASASVDQIERAAGRRARVYRWLGTALGSAVFLIVVFASREIAEGFDVLMTRGAIAPIPMRWTERLRMVAQPPAYLHAPPRRVLAGATSLLPKGTGLTLRARPLYAGRSLVVTDGVREAPFVSDGEGGLVAHYTVEDDVSLVVAARFGDVLIPEPEGVRLIALPDEAPVVTLEGAPATLRLSELERIELRWSALDDHSLEQVDLVLRSGTRQERRLLATYDDGTAEQHGGHVLSPSDPFLRSLFLPAEIYVEARDNDPVGGSKWGKSAALTLVPSAVGEADALRYAALVRARDGLVDALAVLDADEPRAAPDAQQLARFEQRFEAASAALSSALHASYAGLEVPPIVRNFALGRVRVVEEAESRSMAARRAALEDLILGLDSALGALSNADARGVARVLGDVAEEAMVGAEHARQSERQAGAIERLDRAIAVLSGGAGQLLTLGILGHDLGSVALADLGRVRRAREASDFFHAELAARHMAERLRRPLPSFGASGAGGVEAGRAPATEPHGEASDAQQAFDDLSRQIMQLAREHAASVERVDQTLSEAEAALDLEALRPEAERRAAELREAVALLPEPGHSPGTPEAAAALAAEHARAMAHNLESLRLSEALESSRRALGALDDALKKGPRSLVTEEELRALRSEIEEHARWTEEQLTARRQALQERARELLEQPATIEEQLAESAAGLAKRGAQSATPLPREALERLQQADQLMRQAAKNLRQGEGESGQSLQRQAQRLLESADPTHAPNKSPAEPGKDDNAEGRKPAFGGNVPEAEEKNKAEEFRRRVLESLGADAKGRLGPAIQRYAEGLLR